MFLLALAMPLLLIGVLVEETGDDDTNASQEGSAGDDTLTGSAGDELLRGNAGDDVLQGLDGADTLFGNAGEDVLVGAGGDDMLCSGNGDDIITGNRGADTIEGQGGNDWISADYFNDTAFGNQGDDTVIGGRGFDEVNGDEGDDVLFGGIVTGLPLETDELEALRDGESLADILAANDHTINMREDERDDTLNGGEGDDTLFVGGADMAWGGADADTFNIMADHTSTGSIAEIMDYDAAEDAVGVVVNAGEQDMDITVEDDGEDAIVRGNGAILARVEGAAGELSAADIAVMVERNAAVLLDPNAS